VRDPARKWGHYDSELPVAVIGVTLSGCLTTTSALGSYVLRIKNLDLVDGLEATQDAGEYVSFRDLNVLNQEALGRLWRLLPALTVRGASQKRKGRGGAVVV